MEQNIRRPIVLLYPPQADPTQPYSSLPALTGFLRSKNIPVIQRDINIIIFNELLKSDSLNEAKNLAISRRTKNKLYEDENFEKRYQQIIGFADYLIDNITEAKKVMREPNKFFNIKIYNWAVQIIYLSCDLLSLPYYPTLLTPGSCEFKEEYSFYNLLNATSQTNENLFYEMFERKIIPQIRIDNPLFVGLSITFESQLVPGFTIARLLKNHFSDIHINIGGALIQRINPNLFRNTLCFEFADSYTIGEGETALEKLYIELHTRKKTGVIPNTIRKDSCNTDNSMIFLYEDITHLPCPDFKGLDLELYLSPEPVFLLSSSRGCYHGKCAFCDISMNTRNNYRGIDKDIFSAHLSHLIEESGAKRFWFCDDAMPINSMLSISRDIIQKYPHVTWATETRFEKAMTPEGLSFFKKGGCRILLFGLESVSQRILDLMRKNNTHDTDRKIIESCTASEIGTTMYAMIGFPTETREEAQKTVEFLQKMQQKITYIALSKYSLYKNTDVYNNPSNYGIFKILEPDESLFNTSLEYVPISGMTPLEAAYELESALKKLSPIYSTRMISLAMTHHLLYLSHYRLRDLYKMWAEIDAPKWTGSPKIGDLKPILASVISSNSIDDNTSTVSRMLNIESGECFLVSQSEKYLLTLCNGIKSVDNIVDLWIGEVAKNESEKIDLKDLAFALIRAYLISGVLRGK